MKVKLPKSVDAVQDQLSKHNYISDRSLSTAIFLMMKIEKPIFLEGEPGVGKTEVGLSLIHIPSPRDATLSRMPSSA